MEPLALEAALHVGQREHHRVDLALGDRDAQLFQRERSFPHRRVSITKVYWQNRITVNAPCGHRRKRDRPRAGTGSAGRGRGAITRRMRARW
ncbi:hypothetical protein GCM10027259_10250 [Micromonospora palomenae]